MPSKYAPDPDSVSRKVINFFERKIRETDHDSDAIDKESRRFRSIYSSVVNHAMRKGQGRREAHRYALRTYVEQAPDWAGNLLRKSRKEMPIRK